MSERSEKYEASMIKKYKTREKWQQAMREFGARADKTTPRGFKVMDEEKHREISKQGAKARWDKHSEQQKATEKAIFEDEDGFITKI